MNDKDIRYLLDNVDNAIKSLAKHPEYDSKRYNGHLYSVRDKFVMDFFEHFVKLDELIDDLLKIKIFIQRFPSRKYYEANNVDQLQFIKYHLEVFYHKIHTILEIQKLIVNVVYRIGLREKDCSWENLIKHAEFTKSPMRYLMDEYYNSFKHIISARHLNSHRSYFGDQQFADVNSNFQVYNLSKRAGIEVGAFRDVMPEFLVERQIKNYRSKKKQYVENAIKVASQYIELFKTIALKEFRKNHNKV